MQDFTTQLVALHPFFGSVAQIGGTLLGLIFVALTFNPRTLGMRHDPILRSLAEQIFSDFVMVMLLSLWLLIPQADTRQIGAVVAAIAVAGMLRFARNSLFPLLRAPRTVGLQPLQRFWLSLLGHIGFLVAGILLYQHAQPSIVWSALVSSPILLLVSGARSTWLLVMRSAG
ncbi:MAG: hypothetical protein ACREPH_14465 [Rhodanobacteraceae bacterium]